MVSKHVATERNLFMGLKKLVLLVITVYLVASWVTGEVNATARVIVDVEVLTDHSAKVTLKWSDDRPGDDLRITGWTFDDKGLTLKYDRIVGQSGYNRRTVEHDVYTFPMKVYLEKAQGHTEEFTDLNQSDPGYKAILNLYYRGIISGYPDGSFKAVNPVKRAEFAKLLMTTADYEQVAGLAISFKDVEGHWASDYIMTLTDKGIFNGKGQGVFDPEGQIKVGEVLAVLTRTFDLYGEQNTYPYMLANHWSNRNFLQAVADGIVVPEDEIYGNYDADQPATRALCAVLLSRVVEHLHDVVE